MFGTVTDRFVRKILKKGRLAEARDRHNLGHSNPKAMTLGSFSCWSLVCEEVLDTDYEPEEYDAIYTELLKRGITKEHMDEMRSLAWKTAGWLNYDMMLWEWVKLDESDIKEALRLKLEKKKIKLGEYDESLQKVEDFLELYPPRKTK